MAVNPDPKPGRWILPLVILGMIAFTYFFVREIDEASTDTTLSATPGSTTTTLGDGSTTSTTAASDLDPETQAYLDEIAAINADLQLHRTEVITVNTAFNEDPRGIEYSEAETRFEAVVVATEALADRLRAVTPPPALAPNHTTLQGALDQAALTIAEALAGLRSTDTGEQRNAAVEAFVTATTDYETEVTNTNNTALANA